MGWSPSQTFILDCGDSAFCPLLPGQDADPDSGWATKGTTPVWNHRAHESPGQVLEPKRTQLSQDLGGGTLAIDTLQDNGTRVVVSAIGMWREGAKWLWGAPLVPRHACQTHRSHIFRDWPWRSAWKEGSQGREWKQGSAWVIKS